MPLVLPALLCVASGLALVSVGWTHQGPLSSDFLLRMSLSVPYGLGIFSVMFFLARVFNVMHLMVADLLVLAALFVIFFSVRTGPPSFAGAIDENRGPAWFHRFVTGAFVIALCGAAYAGIMRILVYPQGTGWDAFAIWNLHARFLYFGGLHWRDGFTPLLPWSHPDYPLLLPSATAHFWTYLGHDAPAVPGALGLTFTFCTVGVLFSALSILRGLILAMLGTIALTATPAFIEQGSSQYADVPLSFFFLATIALLCLTDRRSVNGTRSPGRLVLAGVAAAFGAWTKNEGQLFLCAIVAARVIVLMFPKTALEVDDRSEDQLSSRAPRAWNGLVPLLVVAVPAILLIAWYKYSMPTGDLLSDPASRLNKLLDPGRYWIVVTWYAKTFFRFGHWLIVPGTVALVGFYVAMRRPMASVAQPGVRTSVLTLVLTLAGCFAIYLITPNNIYWQLRFSLDRVFLQLWPSAIFLFLLSVPSSATSLSSLSTGL